VGAAPLPKRFFVVIVAGNDVRDDERVKHRILLGGYGDISHKWAVLVVELEGVRGQIFSTASDDVRFAPAELEAAVRKSDHDVSGTEPGAVNERRSRRVRVSEVAEHQATTGDALDPDLAWLAVGHVPSVLMYNPNALNPKERPTDRYTIIRFPR
jgi:hypothetical protein